MFIEGFLGYECILLELFDTRSYRDNFDNKITKLPHIYAMSKFESVFPNISVIHNFYGSVYLCF